MHVIERNGIYELQDVAELLGLSLRTVQRLVSEGKLPARAVGRKAVMIGADLLDGLPFRVAGEELEEEE
jgi:DNA binding domain, excisionase family